MNRQVGQVPKNRHKPRHTCKGYALLEAAVALAVTGAVAAMLYPAWQSYRQLRRQTVIHDNYARIRSALIRYVLDHRKLPCPAPLIRTEPRGSAAANCAGHAQGGVPFKTLGLPAHIATDEAGQPLIYAVEPKLTNNFKAVADPHGLMIRAEAFCGFTSKTHEVVVHDLHGQPVTADEQDFIAWILMPADYPKTANGAVRDDGSRRLYWKGFKDFIHHDLGDICRRAFHE